MLLESAVSLVRSRLASAALLVLTCAVAGACGEANQTVKGGELRFDAALPTGGGSADGGDAAPVFNLCFKGDPTTRPATWAALYADYFGGGAACAGQGSCHGDANGGGFLQSNYMCPRDNPQACYDGITKPDAKALGVPLVNTADPEASGLQNILRKVNGDTSGGGNRMPQSPTCYFSEADMSRILTWMRNGAPND